jgi:uncharacterized protein DUF3800
VLHRKELVNRRPPFQRLNDRDVESRFNESLMQLLTAWEYRVITVVIDKQDHLAQYGQWAYHPYHYCLKCLLERFVMLLRLSPPSSCHGDVMAESRGGKEDAQLKREFRQLFECGTEHVEAHEFAACLTSAELKVKQKALNVAGLQLADVIAHPSFAATLARREDRSLPLNFGGRIAAMLEELKYRRRGDGSIWGWGRVWLP